MLKTYTNSLSLANFIGSVVGFLNVCKIRLRRLLLAASLSFEIEMVSSNETINRREKRASGVLICWMVLCCWSKTFINS